MIFYVIYKGTEIIRSQWSDHPPMLDEGESYVEMPEKFNIDCHCMVEGQVVGDLGKKLKETKKIKATKRRRQIEQMAVKAAIALLDTTIQQEYEELGDEYDEFN